MGEQEHQENGKPVEKNELSDVLEKLMEYQERSGEKNTLIMLALLNLFGIVSGLSRQEGGDGQGSSPLGQMPFNPAMLLNLLGGGLGGGQGKGFDISSLMGMLANFLGGMPGGGPMPQTQPKNNAPEKAAAEPPVGKTAGKMKVEKNVSQPFNAGGQVKPESKKVEEAHAKKYAGGGKAAKKSQPEVIKWDFGGKEKE